MSPPARIIPHSLSAILVEAGVVSPEQIEAGLSRQRDSGRRIGETLVDMGAVTEADIGWALARQLGLQFIDLEPGAVDHGLMRGFPEGLLHRLQAVPLFRSEHTLSVALADPTDAEAVHELEQAARCTLNPSVATPTDIERVLQAVLGPRREAHAVTAAARGARFDVEWDRSGATFLLFHLSRAARARAGEIHFLPEDGALAVHHRVGNGLRRVATEPYEVVFSLLARLEALGGPTIDERDVHVLGQVVCPMGESELPVDVSLLNVDGGVAIVLGLRPTPGQAPTLDELGLPGEALARLRALLYRPAGLVLLSGPARSGCSTTLAGLLGATDPVQRRRLAFETRPGPRPGGSARVVLDPARARAQWPDIVVAQNADVVALGDVLTGERLGDALGPATAGRLVMATTDWLDSFAMIEHLSRRPHQRAALAQRLLLVLQQRRVRVTDAAGVEGWSVLFEPLFVEDPLRGALARGEAPERLRRLAEADGFRGIPELVAALQAEGRLDEAEAARVLS